MLTSILSDLLSYGLPCSPNAIVKVTGVPPSSRNTAPPPKLIARPSKIAPIAEGNLTV
jgi:hypothetical protein